MKYTEDEVFQGVNFAEEPLTPGEYENCIFKQCIFHEANASEIRFSACIFEECDWSNAKLLGTSFQDCQFKGCKVMGLHFEDCNPLLLSFNFADCTLDFTSFHGLSLKKMFFQSCQLKGVDFEGCDLSQARFPDCDLLDAVFEDTNLEKADFSTAFNFRIDPLNNRIKKAIFSKEGLIGLLQQYDIKVV